MSHCGEYLREATIVINVYKHVLLIQRQNLIEEIRQFVYKIASPNEQTIFIPHNHLLIACSDVVETMHQ